MPEVMVEILGRVGKIKFFQLFGDCCGEFIEVFEDGFVIFGELCSPLVCPD